MQPELNPNTEQRAFEQLAAQNTPGFVGEFWDFLRNNKKWWLAPIVIIMLLFGTLLILSGTAAAPFIYTLF
jgi:drug/metabolite transporter superfamily protein YnfA